MTTKISAAREEPTQDDGSRSLGASVARDQGDEISLRDVLVRIWRGKWTMLVTTAVVVGAIVLWMKVSSPRYTAEMVLAPASDSGAGGLSSKLAQYSGLAALAGIDLSSTETVQPFTQFTESITSPLLAERLQAEHGVLAKVFVRRWTWDEGAKEWRRKESLLTPISKAMRSFFDLPAASPPTPLALSKYLEKNLVLTSVARSGMVKLEFEHRDPEFARTLLGWLHKEGAAIIREESETRTSRQIGYIERKLRTTTAADHRRSLIQLLLDQERQMMMIQVDLPFAARVIQPPTVSDDPTFPRPPLFIAVALIGGLMLGVFMVFFVDAVRGRRARPARWRLFGRRQKTETGTAAGGHPVHDTAGAGPRDAPGGSVDPVRAAE